MDAKELRSRIHALADSIPADLSENEARQILFHVEHTGVYIRQGIERAEYRAAKREQAEKTVVLEKREKARGREKVSRAKRVKEAEAKLAKMDPDKGTKVAVKR